MNVAQAVATPPTSDTCFWALLTENDVAMITIPQMMSQMPRTHTRVKSDIPGQMNTTAPAITLSTPPKIDQPRAGVEWSAIASTVRIIPETTQ